MRYNYANQVPIGIPHQLLKETCFTCSMATIWDHLVTQENRGSKLPIVIPYQQLIHTLLYLLYGLIWDQSVTQQNCVPQSKRSKTEKAKTDKSVLNTNIQWGYF